MFFNLQPKSNHHKVLLPPAGLHIHAGLLALHLYLEPLTRHSSGAFKHPVLLVDHGGLT